MFSALLVHTAIVRRRSGQTDRFGQPVDVNPRQGVAGQTEVGRFKCRLEPGSGGMTMQERAIDTFETEHVLYMAVGADIREDDSVEVIDTRSGETLLPIAKVKNKSTIYDSRAAHHLEIRVWTQRGPS